MLIYKNIEGQEEAVSKKMIVRFSRKDDFIFNGVKQITIIHLTNSEQLRSLDEMETLIEQVTNNKKNRINK